MRSSSVARPGNRSVTAAPSNIYGCRPFGPSGHVLIHYATVDMWKTLVSVCGRPELGDDPRFADRRDRSITHLEHYDCHLGRGVERAALIITTRRTWAAQVVCA
jgi:crotonobetainyl-CoA:carnitine CoA-transferase CaiB-like acyl-CoA transferase